MRARGVNMNCFKPDSDRSAARALARSGMIAAMYVVLTMAFRPISFGPIQFRIAEALMLLPVLTVDAVPGLFIGCLLANLLGGGVWFDVALGSVATLLAALFAYRWRRWPALSAFSAVLFNGAIVGPVVYFAYVRAPGDPVNAAVLLSTIGTVALGELVVCYGLGLPMLHGLRCLPERLFGD